MKVPLTTFTALTAVLAFSGAASAGVNLPVMNQPNITAPPPPMILPQIVRPDIVPGIDTSRLAKQKARSSSKKGTKATKSRPTTKTTRVRTDKAGRDKRVRNKHVRSKPLIANPPLPRLRPDFAERLRGRADDLMLAQELARLGDLRERLGHNNAIDDASLGGSGGSGGSGRSGFDWRGLVPESNTEDEGPQNDRIWRPEGPGDTAYNPGMDQTGGFTRPGRERRDSYPGFSRTPGRAGAGLPGQGGETSQDGGGGNCGPMCWRETNKTSSGGSQTTTVQAIGGLWQIRVRVKHADGSTDEHSTLVDRNGDDPFDDLDNFDPDEEQWGYTHTPPPGTPDSDMTFTVEEAEAEGPDSQPVPEDSSSGESMPCPKGSRACGEPEDTVSWRDKVAQPGRGDTDGPSGGFRASVAERKNVVTNPVDPENHMRTGGNNQRRPMEWVTQPGGNDPDTPPGR